jgi:hypothetical protein
VELTDEPALEGIGVPIPEPEPVAKDPGRVAVTAAPSPQIEVPEAAPEPVVVQIPEEPAELQAPEPARVQVVGGPAQQRLVSDDGKIHRPGLVPPGRYRFEAQMEKRGNWVELDLGLVTSGQQVRIACDHDFGYCKIDAS